MSKEKPDIRIDGDGIDEENRSAEDDSFGVTAYLNVPSSGDDASGYEAGLPDDYGYTQEYTQQFDAGLEKDRTRVYDPGSSQEQSATIIYEHTDRSGDAGADEDSDDAGKGSTVVFDRKTIVAGAVDAAAEDGQAAEGAPGSEDSENENAEPVKDPEIEAIKDKIRERKREKRRKAKRRRVRFWTFLSVLLISIAAFIFSLSSFFTVDSIEVRDNSHYTDEEIINIAHAVPGHNIFYELGSAEIIEYLEQNPYIKSAVVTRKLPSTMVITVNERKQACAFKYDDDYLVMDDEGILLRKTRTEPKITMLNGLVASKIKLGETIGTENQQMFSRTLKLIRETTAADLYFVRVDMSGYEEDRIVRAYVYNKLMVKGDYDLMMDSISNGRLHKVLEKLFEDGVKRGTISIGSDGNISFEPGI